MKIIIAGAGEVGYHLAKQLSVEDHNISVVDIDSNQLSRVDSSTEVLTILGSSTSIDVLQQAGITNADLVVAVTSSESININTATLSKKLGAKSTIARVSNGEYLRSDSTEMFKSIGVDYLIYPEELAAMEVVKLIERAAATDVLEFEDGKLTLIGLKLDKNAPVIKKSMVQIAREYSHLNYRVVAIHRGMRTIIPSGNDLFLPNDQVFVITTSESTEEIIKLSGKENTRLDNVMIFGGGQIGKTAARMLENSINIKLIESDRDKTEKLADYLQKSLVIQGDGRDLDLLAQEGIVDMDGFIAVTNDAETNIISCLMAKHLGVSKTIALVDNIDYIPLTQTIGLDSLINKKLIAADNITKFIRESSIISVATLQGIDAEVLEYIAKPGSAITKSKVRDLKFPKDAIIGGYIRDNQGYITIGDSKIHANDKVVVFALPGAINKVEKYFRK